MGAFNSTVEEPVKSKDTVSLEKNVKTVPTLQTISDKLNTFISTTQTDMTKQSEQINSVNAKLTEFTTKYGTGNETNSGTIKHFSSTEFKNVKLLDFYFDVTHKYKKQVILISFIFYPIPSDGPFGTGDLTLGTIETGSAFPQALSVLTQPDGSRLIKKDGVIFDGVTAQDGISASLNITITDPYTTPARLFFEIKGIYDKANVGLIPIESYGFTFTTHPSFRLAYTGTGNMSGTYTIYNYI